MSNISSFTIHFSNIKKQAAVFEMVTPEEINALSKEKERFVPVYTAVQREIKRNNLQKRLTKAQASKDDELCQKINCDINKLDSQPFTAGIAQAFQDPTKREKIFSQAQQMGL